MNAEKIMDTHIFDLVMFTTNLGIYIMTDVPIGDAGFTFINKETKEFAFAVCDWHIETVLDFIGEYFEEGEEILEYQYNVKSKNRKKIQLEVNW